MKPGEEKQLTALIADYLEQGFLENILAMFRKDPDLFTLMGDILSDPRVRVRLGATALMEELTELRPNEADRALPSLIKLLDDENPVRRGDAVWLVGVLGGPSAAELITPLLKDPEPAVAETAREALAKVPVWSGHVVDL